MINKLKSTISYIALAIVAVCVFWSCETEYVDALYTQNEITSFNIDLDGTKLYGAISDGSIIIYESLLEELPETVSPEITISENATILPASKESISLEDGTSYTVTAQDGSTASYVLNIIPFNTTLSIIDKNYAASFGNGMYIVGSGFLLDSTRNQVFFISENDNTEHEMVIDEIVEDTYSPSGFGVSIRVTIPEEEETELEGGYYKIKVISGPREVVTDSAILKMSFTKPSLPKFDETQVVSQGGTITFTGNYLGEGRGYRVPVQDAQTYLTLDDYNNDVNGLVLPIVEHTFTSVTYSIPDDAPLGEYQVLKINTYDKESDEYGATRYFDSDFPQLIITE